MKKHNFLVCTLICTVSTIHASPIYLSKFDALCASIAKNQTFRAMRKVGYLGTIGGMAFVIARYLNDLRNSSHTTQVQFIPSKRKRAPQLTVKTSGTVTVHGQDDLRPMVITQELKNPEPPAVQVVMSHWQRFCTWLISPPYTGYIQTTASVPHSTDLTLTAEHANDFDTGLRHAVDVHEITGEIKATTHTGSIYINEPQGPVTVSTNGAIIIPGFSQNVTVEKYGSLEAIPRIAVGEATPRVYIGKHPLPIQERYLYTCD
jgi:hypothetical protein